MSRTSQVIVLVLALAVGAVVGAMAVTGDAKPAGDLEKQIQALNNRVANLEKQIQALKTSGAAAQGNPAAENEANAALNAIKGKINSGDYETAKKDMNAFLAKYGTTKAGRSAQRMAKELAVFGKDSPSNWGVTKWFQGENDIKLDGKGTTMVVFWELWCPHCKREVPKLEKLYTDYKSQGLKMIGVTKVTRSSTDESVAAFLNEQNVSYPIAKEDGTLSSHFNVQGIPAAAVVKDGTVVWRGHPAALNEATLKGWL